MATTNTGEAATRLSEVDLSGANFSRQGVVDRSAQFNAQAKAAGITGIAGAIQEGGAIAIEADEGFAKAQLQGNINDFIAQTKPEEVLSRKQSIFNDVNNDLRDLQSRTAQPGSINDNLDENAPEYVAIMSKLKLAEKQGVMTRDELELRAKEATRKAINRRPGMATALTQHAEQVLNLSGVRDIQDFEDDIDKLEAKRAEEARKLVISQAVALGIPFDILDAPIQDLNIQIEAIRRENEAFENAQKLGDLDKETIAANIDNIRREAPLVRQGIVNAYSEQTGLLFTAGMSEAEKSAAFVKSDALATTMINMGDSILTNAGLSAKEAAPLRDALRTQIISARDALKNHLIGEDLATLATNNNRYLRNMAEAQLEQQYDVPTINMMGRLSNSPMAVLLSKSDDIQKGLGNVLGQLAGGELSRGGFNRSSQSDHLSSGVPDLVSTLQGSLHMSVAVDGDPVDVVRSKDAIHFENAITQISELLIDNPHGVSSEVRANNLKHVTKMIGDPANIAHLNNASPGAKKQMGNMLDQYSIGLTNLREKAIKEAEDVNVKVVTRFEEDGRMVFDITASDPGTQRQFENKFNNANGVGTRSNELIKAMGVLFGTTGKDTARIIREKNNDFIKERGNPAAGDDVVSLIKDEEGFTEDAFLDSAGVPTIGYGFTKIDGKPVELGDSITREESEEILTKQIREHSAFSEKVDVTLSPSQKQALSSFEFNLGSGIWDGTGKAIIQAVNEGDLRKAAEVMKRHDKARDPNTKKLKTIRGLTKRREREASLLLGNN